MNDKGNEFQMAELYVQAAHTTTKRCYWAYSALLLVCITAVLTFYNEYCSYMERFITISSVALSEPLKGEYIRTLTEKGVYSAADSTYYTDGNPVFDTLWKELVKNWVETQYVEVPLLGIKLSTSDVMVLMSFLFLIIMAWCYYCIRSENFAVGKVLINTQDSPSLDLKKYIFYGICFNNIFFPATTRDIPYKRLKYDKNVADEIRDRTEKLAHNSKTFTRIKRYFPKLLFIVPILLLSIYVSVHIFDLYTISKVGKDSFQELVNKETVDEQTLSDCKAALSDEMIRLNDIRLHLNTSKIFRMCFPHGITSLCRQTDTRMIWFSLCITVIILLVVSITVHRIFKYLNGTNHILYDYRKRFKNDESKEKLREKVQFVEKDVAEEDKEKNSKLPVVTDIRLRTSGTTCGDTFEADMIFGLTAGDVTDLLKNLEWMENHIQNAKEIISKCCLRAEASGLKLRENTEYYILLKVGSQQEMNKVASE